jgi:two-component system, OmpR family, alkaline phosphatase synthesis response regulator PhoP
MQLTGYLGPIRRPDSSVFGTEMARETILIIEDEPDLAELVAFNLRKEGFDVVVARTGEDGLKLAVSKNPSVVLLDLMLPGLSGLDVCRMLRSDETTHHLPIIMMTARSEEIDVVTGLEIGADDYLTKPFSQRILAARIRAVLRRRRNQDKADKETVEVGELKIDLIRHQVSRARDQLDLTPTEFELLLTLARRPGWVFTRSQLIDALRDGQQVITDRAIDVQVANLRKKLGDGGEMIETVRGVGYRLRESE